MRWVRLSIRVFNVVPIGRPSALYAENCLLYLNDMFFLCVFYCRGLEVVLCVCNDVVVCVSRGTDHSLAPCQCAADVLPVLS